MLDINIEYVEIVSLGLKWEWILDLHLKQKWEEC